MDLNLKPYEDPGRILKTDLLDLLFEGRNKAYGAYELRKTYNRRITMALLITFGVGALIVLTSFLANRFSSSDTAKLEIKEVQLEDIKQEEEKKPEPPPPPPPKVEPPKVEMTKFTPPKIVKDEEVKKEDIPPEMEKLEDTKIAVTNQVGVKDAGLAAPPVDAGKAVVEAPKAEPEDKIFEKVEIEAKVDLSSWKRHLERNLQRYIEDAAGKGMAPGTYTVQVKFLVERDGSIADVRALNDPGYGLGKGAEEVVRKGPKWSPGIQNGKEVRSYHTQPITFVVQEAE
ncbi:MAG: energy transducer TonB [Flavisolibacter sp.]|nr:energy transducer TonB [Flavisolibacter sp.]